MRYAVYDPLMKENVAFEDASLEWLEDAIRDVGRFNIQEDEKLTICINEIMSEIRKRKEKQMNQNPFMQTQQTNSEFVPFDGAPPVPDGMLAPSAGNDAFSVDLSDVRNGYNIPEGTYKVKCVDVEQTVAKTGNPMFVWTFAVDEPQYSGFEIKHFTAITPAAMWKVGEVVQALGLGVPGQKCNFTRQDALGKTCNADIIDDEYNGRTRSRIDKIYAQTA